MRRGIAAVSVGSLVLIAWLALLWWSRLEVVPPANGSSGNGQQANPAAAAAARGDGASSVDAAAAAQVQRDAVAVEAASAATANEIGIEVEVVDHLSGRGVAGARLLYWDAAADAAWDALPEDHPHRPYDNEEQRLRNCGRIAQADEQGRARIAVLPDSLVVAEADGAFGSVAIDELERAPAERVRIPILADRSLRVRLQTASGEPVAGVGMQIFGCDSTGEPDAEQVVRRESTGDDGAAWFQHLQWPRDEEPALVGPAPRWVVPDLPGCTATRALVRGDALPAEMLVLTLPPCGSVVAILPAGPGFEKESFTLQEVDARLWTTHDERCRDGRVEFANVGLGVRYRIRSWRLGMERQFDGPKQPGEVVTVVLADGEDAAVLVGTAHDAAGAPIAGKSLLLDAVLRRGTAQVDARTDDVGRFAFRSRELGADVEILTATIALGSKWAVGSEAAAIGPRTLKAGRNELGVVQLVDSPLLVSVRLVLDGEALPAYLHPVVEQCAIGGTQWAEVAGLQHERDGSKFTLRGPAPAGRRLRIHFGNEVFLRGGPREFVAGATDLELAAVLGVEFAACVRFDEAVPPHIEVEMVPLRVEPEMVALVQRYGRTDVPLYGPELRADRAWFHAQLPPGTYRLVCRLRGFGPIAAVDGVELAPRRSDPRVLDLDLRGKLAHLVLDVLDEKGQPCSARLVPLGRVDLGGDAFRVFDSGETLVVPKGPQDLLVYWFDYPPVEVRGAEGRVVVRVEKWRARTFEVTGVPKLPKGVVLRLEATPSQGEPESWTRREHFEQCGGDSANLVDGRVELLCGDRPMRLGLTVWVPDRGSRDIPGIEPAVSAPGTGTTMVRVPTAEVERVVRELMAAPVQPR